MIGILPTLRREHLAMESLSANPRYALLNEQIFAARGEDLAISIDGVERLAITADTVAPEAACTSTQFHLQVSPAEFAAYWNAAQAIAGVQVALGANSPFLLGRELWRETRIPLFEQATDTRSEEIKAQGVRPRVWFGERWITSVFDLFEENVRYFPALLPICDDEDPVEVLAPGRHTEAGRAAAAQRHDLPLEPARLRRGQRPAAPAGGEPGAAGRSHRRRHHRQRRVLLRTRAHAGRRRAAGLVADVVQRGRGELPPGRRAMASRPSCSGRAWAICPRPSWCCGGCCRWRTRAWTAGASTAGERDRLLGIIEQRCLTGRNGASWQVGRRTPTSRSETTSTGREALRRVLQRYIEHMHTNVPVHEWPPIT